MGIQISNGHLIDPANQVDKITDLFIENGQVVALDKAPDNFKTEQLIDAEGQYVIPGIIDLQARVREPGQEYKASIASETRAAVAGGITTLCLPPDTQPIIDTPAVIELIHRRNELAACAEIVTLGALTKGLGGTEISEMYELKRAGCVGVSNARAPIPNTLVMRRAMEYAANFEMTIFLTAEDHSLTQKGCAHEGMISTRLGLPSIPEATETMAVARLLMLVEQTGVRAHFCQLSTAKSVQMINRAQHDGLPVTADVTTHHLYLTEMDIGYFDSNCHVFPPLRSQRDKTGLREGLSSGTIGAICSDHQPHELDAKLAPFCESEPGMSTIDTLLPLALRLVDETHLGLPDIIARLTSHPAQILGLKTGQLGLGSRADICIFDPQQSWMVSHETLNSRGKNSPFIDWEMKGRVSHTLLAGRVVFQR